MIGRARWIAAVAGASSLALAAACSGKTTGSASPSAGDAGAGAAAPPDLDGGPAAYRITCTFYARDLSTSPPPDFKQVQAIFHTDKPDNQSLDVGPGIPATVSLAAAPGDANDVLLAIDLPASGLTRTFELAALARSDFELVGEEGFSGLNYVSTPNSAIDLQYICEASAYDEARPKPFTIADGGFPSEPLPPRQGPLTIRCNVAGPSGSQSVTLDHTLPNGQVVTAGSGGAVRFNYVDGPPPVDPGSGDERELSFQISRDAHPENGWATQLLFQLTPYQAFSAPLRGPAAMTGTVSLRAPATDAGATDAGASTALTVGCTVP